jgi:hypothetical protein
MLSARGWPCSTWPGYTLNSLLASPPHISCQQPLHSYWVTEGCCLLLQYLIHQGVRKKNRKTSPHQKPLRSGTGRMVCATPPMVLRTADVVKSMSGRDIERLMMKNRAIEQAVTHCPAHLAQCRAACLAGLECRDRPRGLQGEGV